ncbi:putative DNA-binding domain-containing protein [Sulfurivirga sp.]|uniref:HvfC family RiPP maturation protein n=1 Tax=Sulfurivirga sp. TaxID=2614236 RepID=UPI0025F79A48|nr:putative DNA-binding domain-containing protein [Sulfurivirga sp.]
MTDCDFRTIQRQFTRAIRAQGDYTPPCPAARPIEPRRFAVYRELFLNTVSQFFASLYPLTKEAVGEARWRTLMEAFLAHHGAHTPYFHWLGREFLAFLESDAHVPTDDPPWLIALADWEWQEVAVDIDEAEVPPFEPHQVTLDSVLRRNPTARLCHYDWPVHTFSPGATLSPQPTTLLIWRDGEDETHFAALAPLMAALVEALETPQALRPLFSEIEQGCGQPAEQVFEQARPFLQQLYDQYALCR